MPVPILHEWSIIARRGIFEVRTFVKGKVHLGATAVTDQDPTSAMRAALLVGIEHQLFAKRLSEYLNNELHHGGSWQVGWAMAHGVTREPTEMVIRWRDADDDIQLRIWTEGTLPKIMAEPMQDYGDACEAAILEKRQVDYTLDVQKKHTIMAAKGEDRALPHVRGPAVFGA